MKFDLEPRLISFGASITEVAEQMPTSLPARHLRDQVIRSGTAPALLYGEARAAESGSDFIHKMSIALKELRETHNCLQMVALRKYVNDRALIESVIDECLQLIKIFGKSINTAKQNRKV